MSAQSANTATTFEPFWSNDSTLFTLSVVPSSTSVLSFSPSDVGSSSPTSTLSKVCFSLGDGNTWPSERVESPLSENELGPLLTMVKLSGEAEPAGKSRLLLPCNMRRDASELMEDSDCVLARATRADISDNAPVTWLPENSLPSLLASLPPSSDWVDDGDPELGIEVWLSVGLTSSASAPSCWKMDREWQRETCDLTDLLKLPERRVGIWVSEEADWTELSSLRHSLRSLRIEGDDFKCTRTLPGNSVALPASGLSSAPLVDLCRLLIATCSMACRRDDGTDVARTIEVKFSSSWVGRLE